MHVVSIIIGLLAARAGIKSINKYVIRPNALKMELKKYSNTDNIKILELPDDIYLDESKDNEVENNEVYKKVYDDFCSTLTSYVPRTYLDNFYRNFKTITETETSAGFKFRRRITRGTLVYGSYNNLENEIDLGTSELAELTNGKEHELLHASSAYYDEKNNVIYSGFSQIHLNVEDPSKSFAFGMGINEGATQYLANKYFDPFGMKPLARKAYQEEQIIVQTLEKIVGEEKFMSCYFRADSKGLFDELIRYTSKEEVYKFINYTDVLLRHTRDKNYDFKELNEVKEFIDMFLLKAYSRAHNKSMNVLTAALFMMENAPYEIKSR